MSSRRFLPDATVAAGVLVFALACARFVSQPGIASFADDSVSYLVMAQVLSPWQAAPPAVAEAFVREAFYPPLFPVLLALTGAGHDLALAHLISALLIAGILPLAYLLGMRWLEARWAAVAAVVAIALMPSFWIQAKGVLSEPLFCALLLGAFLAVAGRRNASLALALSGLVLTRTVGVVVIGGYLAWALSRRGTAWPDRFRAAWPALCALIAYGLWVWLRPSGTADDYLRIVGERGHSVLANPEAVAALGASLARQAHAIGEGWLGSVMLFWVEGRPVPMILAAALGVLSLAGLALRLAAGKADAWMAAAYLATFLVWPFYDQMTRFLFPALPVLVLYALFAAATALRAARKPALAAAFVAPAFISLSAPALAFIHQRAGSPEPYTAVTDWYRTPDIDRARMRSQVHLDLLADMDAIRRLTRPGDRVMWVAPSYVALLAERRGVAAPETGTPPERYRAIVSHQHPDYVFLSLYHPRDTVSDRAWKTGVAAMAGYAPVVHVGARPDGSVTSMLLKLKGEDLVARSSGR